MITKGVVYKNFINEFAWFSGDRQNLPKKITLAVVL